jgi:predicted CoA-binding protein
VATYADPAVIRRLLTEAEVWAVVGLGDNPSRAAWSVARRLQANGKKLVPVHPRAETVFGEPGYATLADVPGHVDVVDMFVNSRRVGGIVDQAIAAGAGAVWTQLDVVDLEAAARAAAAGLDVVVDRCPAIEAARLGLW